MKYENPQLRTSLAAEYALGTLRGRARARLEKLLGKDAAWREEVTFWNERLSDLALRLPPKAPRDVVWAALEREVASDSALSARKVVPLRSKPLDLPLPVNLKAAPAANSPYWKIATLAASLAAVALGVGLVKTREENLQLAQSLNTAQQEATVATQLAASASATVDKLSSQLASIKPEALPYVAVFAPADGGTDMRWAVTLHPVKKVMRVLLTGSKPMPMTPGAKALELWMIGKDGPHPLGMLPMDITSTPHEIPLPDDMPGDELGMAFTLAVSEEPEGGSPTGKPTGKVLGAFAAAKAI